jgi:hypothetical protein
MIENLFTFVRTLGNQRIEGKKFFVTQVGLLGTLSDNSGSIGTAGKVLSSTGSGVSWITVGSSNVQNLNDLTDVVISTAATGNLLRYDGTSWVNWAPNFLTSYGSLNDLSDVDAANPDNGQILRYNDTTNTWYADDESVLGIPTLQEVTDEGSTTTNSITAGGFSTSGSVTAAVVTTPLIEREGVLTINSEQQVDQGEPNPNLLYVSWMGDNKFVVNADGYAIANAGFKVVGGTSSGFLKANGTIDTTTYLTSYTETQTLDAVTDLGNTTTNTITVGGVTAPELNYGGLLTINADSDGGLQPEQGGTAVPVLSFEWAGTQQGYIDTDGKITFNGFKTPAGTSSGFLKANGTVDTNAYITEVEYIDDIGDVTISSVAVGDVLMFDGEEWVNAAIDNADYVSKVQHEVKAGVAITKGQAVYVTSADGTNMIVGLASNASEATSSKTIGLALSTAAINGHFFVITEGLIDGLNTAGATAGQPVWLGTNGNLIFGLTNKPVAPAHLVYIGVVTRANANNGEIFVSIQNGFELNEIHDALIVSPTVGQLLRRDSDGLWKNWTPNYITADSVDVLTNKRINLSTGLTSATPVDSIDGFLGQNDILLYQDGIDKGGTINVDEQGNITISNPGIGYYSGPAATSGGTRFSVTVAGNTLTGTIAEFNAALTDGDFATQAYVSTQIANLVDGAPTTLDTLNELAAALGDDANFATTVATSIGTKQNQLNGTGFVKANGTTITYDNSSYITTESDPVFVSSVAYGITSENITNWDAAFDWGNHADAGYLTSLPDHTHTISDVTGLQTALDGKAALSHNHDDRYYTETESDAKFYLATNPSDYQTTSGTVANIASGDITNLNAAWTEAGTSIGNGFRVYRYNDVATNKPVSNDNANWLINIYSHPSGGTASYGHQLAAANGNNIYFRSVSNGSFSDWHKFWSTNDFSSTTISNWNTAYGWGNHATAGYLTSFTETDPTVPTHVKSITSTDITDWGKAYGWGDHSQYGYAPIASPSFTGTPLAPTAPTATNSTQIATTAFVKAQGYLSAEADTLQTVTSRGSSTNTDISIGGTGGDRGLTIYHGDYGRIRFYEGSTNLSTIHSFSTSWQSNNVLLSGGALNLTGNTGVTIGGWNDPDAVFRNGGSTYFKNNVGIGSTSADSKLEVNGRVSIRGGNELYFGQSTSTIGSWTTRMYASGSTHKFNANEFIFNNEGYGTTEFARITSTGRFGIGTATPGYTLHVSGDAYINNTLFVNQQTTIEDNLVVTDGISQNNIVGRPYAVWGASGTTSGAVTIKFPGNTSNYGMVHAVVDIYEYSGNSVCTIIIGGHNWYGAWYNYGANVIGQTDKQVRLGVVDGKFAIIIGDESSSWSYGQVVLRKIQNGAYYQNSMRVYNDYVISQQDISPTWVSEDLRGLIVPGNLTVNGTITENSSIRYKKDIVSIESTSSKLELLNPVRYKKIDTDVEEIGLIAEDVAELFPEVVKYDNQGRPDGVNYSRLSVILLKAVQELTERVNKLENK